MSEAPHNVTTEDVVTFNYRGDAESTRYRWVCRCGKRGKGTHPTKDAALVVSLNHVSPCFVRQTKTKPLSNAQKFTRGVTLLAERGFTSDEIWQTIWDLNAALRQGTGLGGGQMSDIIDAALEPYTLHAEARALFDADPSSKLEADWYNLAEYKREAWLQIALLNRQRKAAQS